MTTKKTRRRHEPSVTEAAEYLWAIFDEFRSKTETAQMAMRRARVLLEMAVDQAMKAIEANAVAGNNGGGR